MATEERTTREVVDDARQHLSELVTAHTDLAKLEVQQTIQQTIGALAPLLIAGVLGVFVLGFFGVTGAKALALVVEEWLAWLIVSVALALLAVVSAFSSRRLLRSITPPEVAQQSVRETVEWARSAVGKGQA